MNTKREYEAQLEAAVRRELQELPDLTAPPGLAGRILKRVEMQAAPAPWYRRAWPSWSLPLRTVSLGVFLTAFGLICSLLLKVWNTGILTGAPAPAGRVVERFDLVERTLTVLLNSAKLAVGNLSPLWLALLGMVAVACYAICVGVGTIYYRVAFIRR